MIEGRLIAFEGIGGCGKTAIAGRITAWLRSLGLTVLETKEPGGTPAGTPIGAQLRRILLEHELSPFAQTLGFELDRAITTTDLIRPALIRGEWVVADRHHFGTIAYQSSGAGVGLGLVDRLNELALGGRYPDLSVVLDVDVAVARARRSGRAGIDRFDQLGDAYQERVREGYLFAAGRRGPDAVVIDATPPLDDVEAAARRAITRLILA